MTLPPPGPDLAHRNPHILAERLGRPVGAAEACEACEAVDDEHPGWHTSWSSGGEPSWARPGYDAVRYRDRTPWVYGATTDELAAAIAACPAPRW